ncbi:glypican [Holotrichia oblita]|uniref:Glypican n=1 Tax=Holotrichia oblita TaxID=644536 RepID=A0ACB9TBX5_HOLOL|nr:glypican [Holotrichia oblita]
MEVFTILFSFLVSGSICEENSCCTDTLEEKLTSDSMLKLDNYLKDVVLRTASILETRAKRFDEFFRNMMTKSKKDFHDMFKKTYGVLYLQHAYVFSDLFNELEDYYSSGQVALSETMEKFFSILYQRMFTVINAQYRYEDEYLVCVQKYMNDLKPFGDVPQKLSIQLTRSFVATRTLHKTLSKGATSAEKMLEIKVNEDCGKELVKMQYCGTCKNSRGPGPCPSYCTKTLQNCLVHFLTISDSWDYYVESIDKIAERLLGPFNIEAVVEPINIKISEAIMNFQENGAAISEKIFVSCGKPTLERRRRSANPEKPRTRAKDELATYPVLNFNQKKKHKKTQSQANISTLEKLIRDIKQKVKETKLFWRQLPYQYCNEDNMTASPTQEGSCWNGTTIGNYSSANLQFEPPPSPQVLTEQLNVMQVLTQTLQTAFQGQEVDLPETDEEEDIASGSGSGERGLIDQEDGDVDPEGGLFEPELPETTTRRQEIIHHESEAPPRAAVPTEGSTAPQSFNRAIISYVLPILLIWFGSAFADLL